MRILEILRSETDETHVISTNELIFRLQEQGIQVERKTIYDDLKTLSEEGYDIVWVKKNHSNAYYLAQRCFDMAELRILLDAVQAASFITSKKTKVLVDKIAEQAGNHKADLLKRNITYFDTLKHSNEKIYYSIDALNEAIIARKQISFLYFSHSADGERIYKRDGERYILNPIVMTFSQNNYYLTAYSDKYKDIANYRIDRMDKVEVLEERNTLPEQKLLSYAQNPLKTFAMFIGKEKRVTLRADNALVEQMRDKFGEKIKMLKYDETSFSITTTLQISPTFFAWCFTFGDRLQIVEPEEIVEQYREMLLDAGKSYRK